jgi:hypothetical protein
MDKKNDGTVQALLNIPIREPETTQVEVKRLALKITLQELSYDKLQNLRSGQDADINYLLASIAAPDVRDPRWYQEHMGCPTPVDALKRLLKPGEISKLNKHADILNGYGLGAVSAVNLDADQLQAQAVGNALEDLEKN